MTFKKYESNAWQEPETMKKYDDETDAWVECECIKKYQSDAWEEAWSSGSPYGVWNGSQCNHYEDHMKMSFSWSGTGQGATSGRFRIEGDFKANKTYTICIAESYYNSTGSGRPMWSAYSMSYNTQTCNTTGGSMSFAVAEDLEFNIIPKADSDTIVVTISHGSGTSGSFLLRFRVYVNNVECDYKIQV